MPHQLTVGDLKEIKERVLPTLTPQTGEFRCLVCAGTGCVSCNSLKVRERLEAELKDRGLSEKVKVVITGCNGFCAEGPIMVIHPGGVFYKKLNPDDIPFLIEEHFLKGSTAEKFLY
ncbi:MAG TPA: (2Fe-2S) ferredoxin domain-containing protein, partial [Thermodesulfobacteriota bacterium]|nr:(2Fe-2S) ferredoxin domain-containing protein [Thermodesulfobacteriota bacterium]